MKDKRIVILAIMFAAVSAFNAEAVEVQPAAQAQAHTSRDPKRLWCSEHQAYEDECYICHPELRDAGRLWCKEHGRYEDRCFICHPELRDPVRPFCEKHFLYQDECYLCDAKLKQKAAPSQGALEPPDARAAALPGAAQPGPLMCKEHRVPEHECGICHPELAAQLEPGQGLKVRFASPEAARKAGLATARPTRGEIRDGIDTYAEITFDSNKVAKISLPVSGVITRVSADLGDQVAPGAVLATISSAEIASAANAALLAQQTLQRERRLFTQEISAKKELEAAEAAYRVAHDELRLLGFDEAQIGSLSSAAAPSALLEIRAPFAGEIVERNVVQGARSEAGTSVFVLADRSAMWAMINVPEAELSRIKTGQTVELILDSSPNHIVDGSLTWIAPRVDEHTRMVHVRAEVPNPDGVLRGDAFARARIIIASTPDAITVPRSAIQNVDGKPFAFIQLADDVFEARAIRVGVAAGDLVEVVTGLGSNDEVVVTNSFLVKSQLQIARLGAGCTD